MHFQKIFVHVINSDVFRVLESLGEMYWMASYCHYDCKHLNENYMYVFWSIILLAHETLIKA